MLAPGSHQHSLRWKASGASATCATVPAVVATSTVQSLGPAAGVESSASCAGLLHAGNTPHALGLCWTVFLNEVMCARHSEMKMRKTTGHHMRKAKQYIWLMIECHVKCAVYEGLVEELAEPIFLVSSVTV